MNGHAPSDRLLELARKLCIRILDAAKADMTVSATLDRQQALQGSDIVLVSINTGGPETHGVDVDVPLKHGIRSSVGDTAGPSGISRTLRNVPVVQDIARHLHKTCPRAWLINVTNPMGTLTRAMCMEHDRTVGYCHEIEWLALFGQWERALKHDLDAPMPPPANLKFAPVSVPGEMDNKLSDNILHAAGCVATDQVHAAASA
jgi:alpha-galactosidase